MLSHKLTYSIARSTNVTNNASANYANRQVYINPNLNGRAVETRTISTRMSDPEHMIPLERYSPTPIPVVLWHELGGHLNLEIPHECMPSNYRPEWHALVRDLVMQGKYQEAMAKYGPQGSETDRVIIQENIARLALIENGYYPISLLVDEFLRHPAYFPDSPTPAERMKFHLPRKKTKKERECNQS